MERRCDPGHDAGQTASVPALTGKSIDASGFGTIEKLNPAEIFRLPWPETVETSLIPSGWISSMPAGITYPAMVFPVASPSVGWAPPSGNAFQYSTATIWFAAKPKVKFPDDPLKPRPNEPSRAKETYPVCAGTVEGSWKGSSSKRSTSVVFAREWPERRSEGDLRLSTA